MRWEYPKHISPHLQFSNVLKPWLRYGFENEISFIILSLIDNFNACKKVKIAKLVIGEGDKRMDPDLKWRHRGTYAMFG